MLQAPNHNRTLLSIINLAQKMKGNLDFIKKKQLAINKNGKWQQKAGIFRSEWIYGYFNIFHKILVIYANLWQLTAKINFLKVIGWTAIIVKRVYSEISAFSLADINEKWEFSYCLFFKMIEMILLFSIKAHTIITMFSFCLFWVSI